MKMTKYIPMILCRLCDRNGMILNAYSDNAIKYTELTSHASRCKRYVRLTSGRVVDISVAKILIEGYVTVCLDGHNFSAPIPFRIIQRVCIYVPGHAALKFTVNNFICQAAPLPGGFEDAVRIMVAIETKVSAFADRKAQKGHELCAHIGKEVDTVRMLSRTCLIHCLELIRAEAYQYTAISDGEKRVYTDEDELKEYGDKGILSPDEVSYYNLYVNGVMQPKVNYFITKGRLGFVTEDIPSPGATVILKYVTFSWKKNISMTDEQYYTIADGVKREYTDDDALNKYSTSGIPGPNEVSYYNLYVNGVLQPKRNYTVQKGVLKFTTTDIPQEGRSIILESIAIKDACGHFLVVEDLEYAVIADESRAFCSGDEDTLYGGTILAPWETSYQNLLINAVNQPEINYSISDNCIVLRTEDLPTAGSPLTLQSIRVLNKRPYCRPCNACPCLCLAALIMCLG
jgi:hypothetical protein